MTQELQTPAALGYRMPAEWEPHAATWLAWPHNRDDWPGKFGPIRWVYAEIVRHVSRSEPVELLVQGEKGEADARDTLDRAGVPLDRVTLHRWKTDRVWLRDTGPSFVVRRGEAPDVGVVDWEFNAWAKYDNFARDSRIPKRISRLRSYPRWKPAEMVEDRKVRIVLEGGSIDVNGAGAILTTEECLLDQEVQARNPELDRGAIERAFADHLGGTRTIWLGRGIVGDDTHGHVDDVARFVASDTIVAAVESDPADANHVLLQENLQILRSARDADGEAFRVVELPMPRPVAFEGRRLPASYANFYITNASVLVPTFNDPADRVALGVLADLFPDRQIIGIHALDLVWGLGTLHCLSREEPASEVSNS